MAPQAFSFFKSKIKNQLQALRYVATERVLGGFEGRILKPELVGGLSNKLHCLFAATDFALLHGASLQEPEFGWKQKILFSHIYDLDYFNEKLRRYHGGRNLIVPKSKLQSQKALRMPLDLWQYSEKLLKKERDEGIISKNSAKLRVLEALKLRPEYQKIAESFVNVKSGTAVQIRTESDWQNYAAIKKPNDNKESIFVDLKQISEIIRPLINENERFFFTSGENQPAIQNFFLDENQNSDYFFDETVEYEINAAINFEICCRAGIFVGNSRSSFSNLVTLQRAFFFKNDESYIYNYAGRLIKRKDHGLYVEARLSTSQSTTFQ